MSGTWSDLIKVICSQKINCTRVARACSEVECELPVADEIGLLKLGAVLKVNKEIVGRGPDNLGPNKRLKLQLSKVNNVHAKCLEGWM